VKTKAVDAACCAKSAEKARNTSQRLLREMKRRWKESSAWQSVAKAGREPRIERMKRR